MSKKYVLYNPYSNNCRCEAQARELAGKLDGEELEFIDMTKVESYSELWAGLSADDGVIICGGDGTLNRLVNDTDIDKLENSVYYYAAGSGNDFARDIGLKEGEPPVQINKYLTDLPHVFVNGMERKFINGVGYGLDGYCCEVGDDLRGKTDKPINYTMIAIKGLLFKYKRANATVTVDGVTKEYKKVCVAPTMNGRYYGGGMIPTPEQDRLNPERRLTLMVFYGAGKLGTLMAFPTIFKGELAKKTKIVDIIEGMDVTVKFDRPTALQIDGETVRGVTEYRAVSSKLCK